VLAITAQYSMETVEGDASRRKKKLNVPVVPPDTAAQIESHKILWEATLEDLVAIKEYNAQIFSKNKI
jgi:hypothetical protein